MSPRGLLHWPSPSHAGEGCFLVEHSSCCLLPHPLWASISLCLVRYLEVGENRNKFLICLHVHKVTLESTRH